MDVACSTLCFTREPFEQALRRIAELEFAKVDLAIADGSPHLSPQDVTDHPDQVLQRIRQGPTMAFAAATIRLRSQGETFARQLDGISRLAQQLAAPVVVVESAPAGTDLEAECARLGQWERICSLHGCILTVTTKTGTLTEDPNVAVALCEAVKGLGLTLDPSHFICGPHQGKPFDQVYPYVRHVHFRDTGRRLDQLQVQVGRGEVEYGRIVSSLKRYEFGGSLTVAIEDASAYPMDFDAEVRKLALLLESLL